MSSSAIDDSLYSRQRYVLGTEAMLRMQGARVLLSGLGPLGVEVAKNIILGGLKSITLHDTQAATQLDIGGGQFYLNDEHVRRNVNRAEASCALLAELNPYVSVDWSATPLGDLGVLRAYSLVIVTDSALDEATRIDGFCRAHGIKFIAGGVRGVFAFSFVDVGANHEVTDADGEAVNETRIAEIAAHESSGGAFVITTLDAEPHELQERDTVSLHGLGTDAASVECVVTQVLKSDRFVISSGSAALRPCQGLGSFVKVKKPFVAPCQSLEEALRRPRIVGSDFSKSQSVGCVLACVRALDAFGSAHGGALPRPWNSADATKFASVCERFFPMHFEDSLFGSVLIDKPDAAIVHAFASTAQGCLQPLAAFFGGAIAQEAQKAMSGKFTPQNGFLIMDAREVLATNSPQFDGSSFALRHDRSDALRICVGDAVADALGRLSMFMIGVGAIGCELVKNFAMLGCCTHEGAVLHMSDPDLIEKSNLNRQFLFRPADIQKPKATTGTFVPARVVGSMNSAMHVVAELDKICEDTEVKYGDDFFERMSVVVNALDNVAARRYVDGRCVATGKPLLESGTLGTKGHVQVIVPHLTCSYTDIRDPPGRDIPFCTLKSFPSKIEHAIEWSRDLAFDKQFVQKPTEFNKIRGDANLLALLQHPSGPSFAKTISRALRMLQQRPASFADCVRVARLKYESYFVNGPKQLLHLFPAHHVVNDGSGRGDQPFWSPPKRAPVPQHFDATNEQHLAFVEAYANLHAHMWRLAPVRDRAQLLSALASVRVPLFVPKEGKRVETDPTKKAAEAAAPAVATDAQEFARLLHALHAQLPSVDAPLCVADFEKDDDSNFHIDLIAACSNLRGIVYGIKPVDRLEAKRIAGRIIPAIATTTSVVSAHVALELIKLATAAPLSDYRNLTCNLALPFFLFSEPDPAHKKVIGDVSYTKWDNWDVRLGLDVPIAVVMAHFETHYGLRVQSIVHGSAMVYHEDFMSDTSAVMRDCVGDFDKSARFLPLVVMFAGKTDADVLTGPTVRYFVKAAPIKKRKVKEGTKH